MLRTALALEDVISGLLEDLPAGAFPGEDPNILPDPMSLTDLVLDLLTPECQRHGELAVAR